MPTQNQSQLAVGDRVQFVWGVSTIEGTILEDRGPIGAGGVRLYRIAVPNDPFEDETTEMPEDELTLVPRGTSQDSSVSPDAVVDYLSHGGLLQILRHGQGGKNPPRVWLGRDSLGNLVHTFHPERGLVGGAAIPFEAIRNGKIFEPNADEVRAYVKSFGLDEEQASRVMRAVGTDRSANAGRS